MIETPARYRATLGLEPQGAPEAYVFPPPFPVLSPPLLLCFSFFLFYFVSIKNKQTQKRQKSCLGRVSDGAGRAGAGGARRWLVLGWAWPHGACARFGGGFVPLLPLCHCPGGAPCVGGCPAGSAPLAAPPRLLPQPLPCCLSGFLRSKTVPAPGCVPAASPGPCAFVSPSPAGAGGGGPVPRDAPKSLACPLCLFPPLRGCLALSLPSPAGNWDKLGQMGTRAGWGGRICLLLAAGRHVLAGGRQRAVLGHGRPAHTLAPRPRRAPEMAVPPQLLPLAPQEGGFFFFFFLQLHPGFVVFLPVSAQLPAGANPLQGGGAAPWDSWCSWPPPPPAYGQFWHNLV